MSFKFRIANRPAGSAARTTIETTAVIANATLSRARRLGNAASQARQRSNAASAHSDAQTDGAMSRSQALLRTGPRRRAYQNNSGVAMQRSVAAYEAATPSAPQRTPPRIS